MTQGQFEALSAEALAAAAVDAQDLALSAEVLETGAPDAQALATDAEVLISSTLSTTEFDLLTASVEVLLQSWVGGNVFDSTGIEHEVFQWNGTDLSPMTFVP